MKEHNWLIIEYNSEYVKTWECMGKKHKRYAKKMTRQLNKHCSSKSQYVLVKVKKREED